MSKKCLPSGKTREDRTSETKNKFDALRAEIHDPCTAALLLHCEEQPVLVSAVAALAKFGTKGYDNLETLFDLEILESVMPLIEHEDVFTRRFATKLLAEMAAVPAVKNYLLDSENYIPHFLRILNADSDTFMQEFSSLILTELSKDAYGSAQLLKQCPDFTFLCDRIQSHDPDIKKNIIEMTYNLLQDPLAAQEIISSKNFNFSLIYELYEQPYPITQSLALGVVEALVARCKDENIQEQFRATGGLQALLNILDKDEWADLHGEALKILNLAANNQKTLETLNGIGGILQLFKYMENAPNSKILTSALDIIVSLANTAIGRKALHNYGIVEYLLSILRDSIHPDAYGVCCLGIGRMARYIPAGEELTLENPIKNIINILMNENMTWDTRHAAVFALNELFASNYNNCQNMLDIQGQDCLLWLVRHSEKVPIDVQITALQALATLSSYPELKNRLINVETIEALYSSFQVNLFNCLKQSKYLSSTSDVTFSFFFRKSSDSHTAELKMTCCEVLAKLCIEKPARAIFINTNGPTKLHDLLINNNSMPVRDAAARLIQQLCADPSLASIFVQTDTLQYLLNNRSNSKAIPSWDICIDALFRANLPVKFAFTRRISLHDVTRDGFYVMKRISCPFPVLDELFKLKLCPMEPVYVVNFTKPRTSTMDLANGSKKRESMNTTLEMKFGKLQPDPFLCEYLELFKCKLKACESIDTIDDEESKIVNIRFIRSRAKMLGTFVAHQMAGPDPSNRCLDHQLELHLNEIKEDLGTSIIPLGQLRVGLHLERALLFKVLADRICLPAALVRGEYGGKTWIEVAIPEDESSLAEDGPSNKNSAKTKNRLKKSDTTLPLNGSQPNCDVTTNRESTPLNFRQFEFPTKLLRPNYIVDLMYNPGSLIPMNSPLAATYCGS
ncbi:armadillo repeat-containing protein 3 [Orussus abietinus]|uniref:armadillo repeat-containing protein 3 n=1 Tax=Orussus abietinus TaxID=222816 RepID=UPI000C716041|nr:armadillo repeat-containing protein 3 [Orussus abietinus]